MIRYVPSAQAAVLTEHLYGLQRPLAVRNAGEITTATFPWCEALNGTRWLVVDTTFTIQVHAEAELDGIADILQPWVGHGLVQGDIDTLETLVLASRGRTLVVYDAFPQPFRDASKSREEMIAAGLLAESVIPLDAKAITN